MKSILTLTMLALLFSIQIFSQDKSYREIFPKRITSERLSKIQKSNPDGLQELNDRESLPLKSKSSNWNMELMNQEVEFYEAEGFNTKDSRTIIHKTSLDNGSLLVEIIFQNWVEIVGDWLNSQKDSYTYDTNNNQIECLRYEWYSSAWVARWKYSYTYDGNNNLTGELSQTWQNVWENSHKYSYTYDANNNQVELIYQEWVSSAWRNYDRISYTYNVSNKLTEELRKTWKNSAWVNNERYLYPYDGNNNQTEFIKQTWYGGFAWANEWKYSYTYNGSNKLIEELYQIWAQNIVYTWVNSDKYTYAYDVHNNQTEKLCKTWKNSDWVNKDKYLYSYNGNNKLTQEVYQYWDWQSILVNGTQSLYKYDANNNQIEWVLQVWENSNTWVNNIRHLYSYDGNNNQIEFIRQMWTGGAAWVNYYRRTYSYVRPTAVNEDFSSVNSYSLSNNYPNPFNPSTKISYTIPKRSNVSLKVFSLLGSEVAELVNGEIEAGSYNIEFDATNLPSGVYFYQLKAGSFIDTKKMILLR